MTEPQSHTFLGTLALAISSYVTADIVSIILGAAAGALWALGSAPTKSRCEALLLVAKLMCAALTLTGFLAGLLEQAQAIPATKALSPIAFGITFVGNRWIKVLDAAVTGFTDLIGTFFKSLGDRFGGEK